MKAYPAYLMMISFFSSGLLFSQQNVTNDANKVHQYKTHEIINNNSKTVEKKLASSNIRKVELIDKTKINNKKVKTNLEPVNKSTKPIPRTTLDLF
ncbi:hypothetical protein D1815_08285 [Aquimarina sp. AD1]|uniref:hypothetical protein n=1 Tax=Aquimarina sp. (strain AD1) TaxID=1714848 RepID=UPI000E4DF55D|nr:hypothetical protein [Aquimarina sp. AD1]AXT55744.1 hypothetical protein D1815_08285 [Aquimarina sp. AD1]